MHTEHSLEHRDLSFDDGVASGHEWRLFLFRQCSQIVGLLSRDWAEAEAAAQRWAADGDAGGTSESGQETAG